VDGIELTYERVLKKEKSNTQINLGTYLFRKLQIGVKADLTKVKKSAEL